MSRRVQVTLLVALLVALAASLAVLYRLRMGQGDVFPTYSTLRADPVGLRALYESLDEIPGVRVTRWLKPIGQLPASPARTVMIVGLTTAQWESFSAEEFSALDAAVRGGSRLVITLQAPADLEPLKVHPEAPVKPKEEEKAKDKPDGKKPTPQPRGRLPAEETAAEKLPARMDLAKLWGLELKRRPFRGSVRRAVGVDATLPAQLAWNSGVYFLPRQGAGWKAIYSAPDPMVLERPLGLGSIVVAGSSYFLSNEALQRDRAVSLLVLVVGQQSRVEFVESHLGVEANPGIAALARRYGLAPAFFSLLVLAGLFAWRRMAHFVPPNETTDRIVLKYNQTAGLGALLRRAVRPADLMAACAAEWRVTARPADRERADAVLTQPGRRAGPADLYNAVLGALRRR
ncbi:MAG: hypothetical protein JWM32_2182 [Verrucomicrobia bacterium]|nr:hypothetical protein [Verrucomicrobiota bacterium]